MNQSAETPPTITPFQAALAAVALTLEGDTLGASHVVADFDNAGGDMTALVANLLGGLGAIRPYVDTRVFVVGFIRETALREAT